MFKKIAITILIIIVLLLGYAATKPDTMRVERSMTINAPPEKIFPYINDFHQWAAWSPWEKMDTTMKRSYTGPESGVGAVYEWEGNNEVGKGRMEIVESTAPSKVGIDLDFLKPFESLDNRVEFTLTPSGTGTSVTWSMSGKNHYIGKVMGIFMNMDKMIGKDFERGLESLKTVAEQ